MLVVVLLAGLSVFVTYHTPTSGTDYMENGAIGKRGFFGIPFSNYDALTILAEIDPDAPATITLHPFGVFGNVFSWTIFWIVALVMGRLCFRLIALSTTKQRYDD